MTTTSRWRLIRRAVLLPLLACLACAVVGVGAQAGQIKEFTGYTRPGEPPDPDQEQPRGDKPFPAVFMGGTVYFMVLDRADGRDGDSWGTGLADFDARFVPGKGATDIGNSPGLDTGARYLYLYQVQNDREGANTNLTRATVRVIVPPYLITSWGHFGPPRGAAAGQGQGVSGVGFYAPAQEMGVSVIRPVAPKVPAVSDAKYRDLAPAVEAPKPYSMGGIRVGPAQPAAGEDVAGIEPDTVELLGLADFGPLDRLEGKGGLTGLGVLDARFGPYHWPGNAVLPWVDELRPGMGPRGVYAGFGADPLDGGRSRYDRRRSPAIRALFQKNPIPPRDTPPASPGGGRSVVFGFTTDFPPVYEPVRIQGPVRGPAVPAADVNIAEAAGPAANGTVPTPVAPAAPTPGVGGAPGAAAGMMSGMGSSGGGGIGGLGGGFGMAPAGITGGGGSGGGRGNGNGGNNQRPNQGQNGNQNQNQTPTVIVRVGGTTVVVHQNQQQQQQQQQQQSQSSCCCCNTPTPNVVPEPASAVLAALGLPFVVFLTRWRSWFKPALS